METKEIMVVVLIGVMLLTVGLQTVQLTGLTNAEVIVPTTSGSGGASVKAQASAGGSPSVPANLQNLPSMVGGC